jgi:predicted dehydrogenase
MPIAVYGRTSTQHHRMEVEETAEAMLTYPAGGTGYFFCSTAEPKPGQVLELIGDKGKLVYRDGQLTLTTYAMPLQEFIDNSPGMWDNPKSTTTIVEVPDAAWGHWNIIRNFARHILFKEPLLSPGAEGMRSLELANAIWLSAHLKRPVKLPISRKAYDVFLATMRRKSGGHRKIVRAITQTDPNHKV